MNKTKSQKNFIVMLAVCVVAFCVINICWWSSANAKNNNANEKAALQTWSAVDGEGNRQFDISLTGDKVYQNEYIIDDDYTNDMLGNENKKFTHTTTRDGDVVGKESLYNLELKMPRQQCTDKECVLRLKLHNDYYGYGGTRIYKVDYVIRDTKNGVSFNTSYSWDDKNDQGQGPDEAVWNLRYCNLITKDLGKDITLEQYLQGVSLGYDSLYNAIFAGRMMLEVTNVSLVDVELSNGINGFSEYYFEKTGNIPSPNNTIVSSNGKNLDLNINHNVTFFTHDDNNKYASSIHDKSLSNFDEFKKQQFCSGRKLADIEDFIIEKSTSATENDSIGTSYGSEKYYFSSDRCTYHWDRIKFDLTKDDNLRFSWKGCDGPVYRGWIKSRFFFKVYDTNNNELGTLKFYKDLNPGSKHIAGDEIVCIDNGYNLKENICEKYIDDKTGEKYKTIYDMVYDGKIKLELYTMAFETQDGFF